jgi:hypothetical protein
MSGSPLFVINLNKDDGAKKDRPKAAWKVEQGGVEQRRSARADRAKRQPANSNTLIIKQKA